jgi:subtilase family serine protease
MRLLRPGTVAERARRRAPRCARRTRSACKAQKPHRASFGATENTFPGFDSGNFSSLLNLRYAFKDALAHGVTVLASSGDDGATDAESDASTLYPFRVNSWPSTDPLVTSVGGTQLNLDDQGNRLSPDVVWNDEIGAGGGGVSGVFKRPLFQVGVAKEVGKKRGTPDISMSASTSGAAWIYTSFGGVSVGWHLVGGTSESSPIFSGIVALADQVAHHRLGLLNPGLYLLGALSQHGSKSTGIVDVTSGNNSFAGVTRFRRRDRLRPGQRLGHDRRGEVRPRARALRLTLGSSTRSGIKPSRPGSR